MATITPNAAGGNWSAGATWVGGVRPTAADDVVYTALTGTLTIDAADATTCVCRSFTASASTGTLAHTGTNQLNIGDGTAGAFTLVSGLTYAPAATAVLNFVSTTTGNNITTAAKRVPSLTFNGVGGAWTFQDAVNPPSGSVITLTNGSLNTNGQTVGSGSGTDFLSNNSNTRTLTLGATSWTLGASNGFWNITTSTGMTASFASSTITFATTTTATTFNGGGLTYGTVSATTLTTGTDTINQANTFSTLTLSTGAGATSQYQFGADQIISGTFTSAGNSVINRAYHRSTVRGTARSISAATFTFSNLDLQDITKAGAGSGNIAAITGNSGDCGGNTGWTFTTPATSYWVPSGGTSTGSFSAVTRWANASGGSAGTGRAPLPQDTSVFNASSIDAGSRTVTQDMSRIGAVDWTGVTNTPAWAKSAVCSMFGNITMVSGMTLSGSSAYTAEKRGALTFTSAGLSWGNPLVIDCVNSVGSFVLADNLTSTSTLTTTSGTLDSLTNSKTLSATSGTFNGGTFNLGATVTLSSTFTINGATIALSTFGFNVTSTCTFQNGTITGTGTIAGGALAFSGTSSVLTATSCTITGTTISWNGSGSTYNVKTITASSTSTETTGTINMYGTITVGASTCAFVPSAGGASGGVAKMAGEGGGFVG